ncbi:RNase P subunit p30-domain-containing protein [Clohesyomyces aquaticus]|uniref:RNase P subunit p30-domain-containing protein n=1 Tax=Clohesyomyces aquaticus TaxID=1231657 RepID=A0A1Y1ZXS5_9PLEO|nr:RNase P subunit p30-domain-containing protein [Clohesyomyces aquaticus]
MFYDLNVPWSEKDRELQRTIAFLDELGYDVVALTATLGKLPGEIKCLIPSPLPFPTPARMRILRRCNMFLTDPTTNHRIPQLQQAYDILAARPTDERTLQQACHSLDIDLISLDLTQRFESHFKFKMLSEAISRGIKIEVCYGPAILASDATAKRNLIGNVVQLIRVTRGRGLVFSSEARSVLGIRAPSDVINLASVWGLAEDRAKDGVTREARSVVEFSRLKRTSFRGAVDFVYGGEKPEVAAIPVGKNKDKGEGKRANAEAAKKRKAEGGNGTPVSVSGEEMLGSKRAKQRLKNGAMGGGQKGDGETGSENVGNVPVIRKK